MPAPKRLESLQQELERSRRRGRALEKEAAALDEQRRRLRRQLIDKAAAVQRHERRITAIETRLATLNAERGRVQRDLARRRETLAGLLAGLQRLQRNPPPALIVQPNDALAAVRSAMLLATVVPELRVQADRLSSSLKRLTALRRSIASERADLAGALDGLEQERTEMKELLAAKQSASEMTRAEIEAERVRMQQLARQAKSLKDLIARLGPGVRTTGEMTGAEAERAGKGDRRRIAATRMLKPSVPFSRTKGRLSLPVSGHRLRAFGAADETGARAKGVSLVTRARAQVTSPADGWVAFAGPFRGYGRLLIIKAGEGYHILLAGMDRINVDVGQFVLSGEPVGTMGQNAAESTLIGAAAEQGGPILYVEFRRHGKSIDPDPWWAERDGKVSG